MRFTNLKNKMMVAVLFCFIIFLNGCGNAIYQQIYKSSDTDSTAKIMDALDIDDKKLFREAIVQRKDKIEGKKVSEILEEQRKIVSEREEKERKERERIVKLRQEMQYMVSLDVTRKFYLDEDILAQRLFPYNGFTIKITNHYSQGIKAFKGTIYFNDLFGERIVGCKFSNSDFLAKNETKTKNIYYKCNPFIGRDVILRDKKLEQMKVVWEVTSVILEDGTLLE